MPRITDKAGRELRVGDRVRVGRHNEGQVDEIFEPGPTTTAKVGVLTRQPGNNVWFALASAQANGRCPDLLRIDNHNEKEKG